LTVRQLLSKFLLAASTQQAPHAYPAGENQPHVQVAKQMIARGMSVNVGDHIPYVICMPSNSSSSNSSSNKLANRAKHPQDVQASKDIDVEWCVVQHCMLAAVNRQGLMQIDAN
jgi:DNA polymerase alpha subunit A